MIVELTFLTGRFHATPWGRHVNEAAPEWPPSPFRLGGAILDSWYRKHPELPAERVERLLAVMSTPPRFRLPPARAGHTRSFLRQGSGDPNDKKLVFDGFAIVNRDATVLVGWPGILDVETHAGAQRLFEDLNYLGRSETWIAARLVDDHSVQWNCEPIQPGPIAQGKDCVSVACIVPPTEYERRDVPIVTEGKGKKARSARLSWFQAVGWGSAETITHTMNRPPAMAPVLYARDADALDAPTYGDARVASHVEGVLYSVEGRVARVRAPLTEALELAERVRASLMSIHGRLAGAPPSWRFSGKEPDGAPRARGHDHLAYLPLDRDRDGWIDHVLVIGRGSLDAIEQRTLDRLDRVWRHGGRPGLVLTPIKWGRAEELQEETLEVMSATPFVPTRHRRPGRDGGELAWLSKQIELECERRGIARPTSVARLDHPLVSQRRARWLDFRRSRKGDAPRFGYGLRLRFAEPVRAPFSLGYASHFGLGCFVPAARGA